MARLSVTTTTLLLAAVAFFIAAGAAEAGQPHNGDAITKDFVFARGIKLHISKQGTATDHIFAGGSKLFIARHDAAPTDHALAGGSKLFIARHDAAPADHASARGSKLDVTQSKISIPKKRLAVSQSKAAVQKKGLILLNYDDLVDALEGVSRAMHKPGTSSESLVEKMTAASTYAGDCDNWYEERDVKSPYEVMQRHLAQMVSVALGLANKKL
uniref:Pectinesterase inhibitor domain-containing protein n=1 Tax=Aegilops tauschii TaxID=37682 RepID=M8C4H8_AEGTA